MLNTLDACYDTLTFEKGGHRFTFMISVVTTSRIRGMVDVCFVVTFRHQTGERSTSVDSDLHAEVGSCSPTLQRVVESFAGGCLGLCRENQPQHITCPPPGLHSILDDHQFRHQFFHLFCVLVVPTLPGSEFIRDSFLRQKNSHSQRSWGCRAASICHVNLNFSGTRISI